MAAPADNQTGIGRSMDCKENRTTSEHIEVKESQDDKQESQRILNINAIGKIANMRDLADKAIEGGTPSDVFQARAFTHMRYLLGWTELEQCTPVGGSPPRQLCVANSRG